MAQLFVRGPQCSVIFLTHKEVKVLCHIWQPSCWSTGQESLYLLEGSHSRGSLPDPTVVSNNTTISEFQKISGNFRKAQYPYLAESGISEELTDFFLGAWPKY